MSERIKSFAGEDRKLGMFSNHLTRQVQNGGTPGVKTMAMRESNATTSSGRNSSLPCMAHPLFRLDERLVLPCPFWPLCPDVPVVSPPDSTRMVSLPSIAETYSAVLLSLTPKKTWLVLLNRVTSPSFGQHFFN